MIDWARVRHFKPWELGASWERLDPVLIYTLDDLREFIGHPIQVAPIHEAFAVTGHSPGGQHPKGQAVDCHVEGIPLLDAWLAAERFPAFLGIGLYPFWRHPGLHLETQNTAGAPRRARWIRESDGAYAAVTAARLHTLLTMIPPTPAA